MISGRTNSLRLCDHISYIAYFIYYTKLSWFVLEMPKKKSDKMNIFMLIMPKCKTLKNMTKDRQNCLK